MSITIYWDVDGTLLLAPPGRADLFLSTVEALGGTPTKPPGRREGLTDRRLAELYLAAAGLSADRVEEFLAELDRQSAAYYVDHPREPMAGPTRMAGSSHTSCSDSPWSAR